MTRVLVGIAIAVAALALRPHAVAPRSCGSECTESFEGRVKFVFKALPPR